jgi:hypothetical protein
MHTIEPPLSKPIKPRFRFRFGLKAIFVVVTVLCLWLGYKAARERRADGILARHDAVLATLVKQIATPPAHTFYSISPGSEDELLYRLGYPGRQFRRATVLRVDHSGSTTSQNLKIDVSKLLDGNTNPVTVADQLIQHYGGALAPIGFVQTLTHGDSTSQGSSTTQDGKTIAIETQLGECRGIWSSAKSDISVVIDGKVFAPSKQAIVSILVIDSQQLYLW